MATDVGSKARLLFLGAAALSLLFPRQWRPPAPGLTASSPPADAARRASAHPGPQPQQARAPRRMWALVQVQPEVLVLAMSSSRAELERELSELNETWNHWELRVERQRYVIQPAPVLQPYDETLACASGRARTEG